LKGSELTWYSYRASSCGREFDGCCAIGRNPIGQILGTWQTNREGIEYESNEPKEENHSGNFQNAA
jgi:hypothetical protein